MTNMGNDLHQLTLSIREFYNLNDNDEVQELAFVFRNIDGSREGKTSTGGDIYLKLPEIGSFDAFFRSPETRAIVVAQSESIFIDVVASESATISLYDNELLILQNTGTQLSIDYQPNTSGDHTIRFEAMSNDIVKTDSFTMVYDPTIRKAALPSDVDLGLNRISNTEIILSLYAPNKENVFLLSGINQYSASQDYQLNLGLDDATWWIRLENLDPSIDYTYQFLVDRDLKIADPLSELILDPANDSDLSNFSDLPEYPQGLTEGRVSYFNLATDEFDWTDAGFQSVKKEDLVIYEILMRDFLSSHNYNDLLDTLTYLKNLGINAIELMPVQEFEGNDSWGYNPSYHMALDKYYGSPDELKAVVDAAHSLDMAVILDVVFNHAFGESPLVAMYWDTQLNRPSAESPYFNTEARHPFNVGYDFNHESEATKAYVKRCLEYWIDEYHIDGYRFDLSKGFTQKMSTSDFLFSAYDDSRVNILLDYAQFIWSINPEHYVILEHFASDLEELELSVYGMMVWSNANASFNEATMGYHDSGKSDFTAQSYQARGWVDPYIISYMESHDEERLMYKNLTFGNSSGSYDVKDLNTALRRNEMASVFFFMIPGPKMMWQFGELGYDQSIDRCIDGSIGDCRLDRKPIRWEYLEDANRQSLAEVNRAMIDLKVNDDLFETKDFSLSVSGSIKSIQLRSPDKNAMAVGNFGVEPRVVSISFPHDGVWFDHFSDQEIRVTDNFHELDLEAGEYRLYFDQDDNVISSVPALSDKGVKMSIFPNPVEDELNVHIKSDLHLEGSLLIYDILGRRTSIEEEIKIRSSEYDLLLDVGTLTEGVYFLNVISDKGNAVLPFIISD